MEGFWSLLLPLRGIPINGVRADYTLAQRDENNSILRGQFGGGKDSIMPGVYDSYQNNFRGIPWLSIKFPVVGYLFGTETRDKVKSFCY